MLNLESLNQRRESVSLKFAKNGLNDPQFSKLFPRESNHRMIARNSEKNYINKSNIICNFIEIACVVRGSKRV